VPCQFVAQQGVNLKTANRDSGKAVVSVLASALPSNETFTSRHSMFAKMYAKGRVDYSTLGHPKDNWDDPRL
jgi:type 1 glutamine amidotransferase